MNLTECTTQKQMLSWFQNNVPFLIKPKSKKAKHRHIDPFTSQHAFDEVCQHLAEKLYNEQVAKPKPTQ